MWESSIATYNQQFTESRIKIVFPDILARLEKQKPVRLLDYGCGAGIFLRDFSSCLGVEQAGYDISAEMIETAKANCKEIADTSIVASLSNYPSNYFDAITKTAVWMCWKTDEECIANLSEIRRLLKPDGKLYAVVTHPAFRDESYSTFSLHLNRSNYLHAGTAYEVKVYDQGKNINFMDYHWPLSAMFFQILSAGFRVENIHEYPDTTPLTRGSPWLLLIIQPN